MKLAALPKGLTKLEPAESFHVALLVTAPPLPVRSWPPCQLTVPLLMKAVALKSWSFEETISSTSPVPTVAGLITVKRLPDDHVSVVRAEVRCALTINAAPAARMRSVTRGADARSSLRRSLDMRLLNNSAEALSSAYLPP